MELISEFPEFIYQKDFASLPGIENSKFNKDRFGVSMDYMLGNTDVRKQGSDSETAIEVLKSLGRIRVKEFSAHDQRTLLNVLDDMLQCKFADLEGLLKNVGLATSRQNYIREMKQNLAAEQDPEKHEKYNITMLLLNAGTMEADTKLHCIIDSIFKKEAEEFYGKDE